MKEYGVAVVTGDAQRLVTPLGYNINVRAAFDIIPMTFHLHKYFVAHKIALANSCSRPIVVDLRV